MENTSGKGTLGFRELLSLAVGQVIGAGVVTLVGQAIGVTGRSIWLAYVFAVVLGLCIIFPYIMLSSMIRVNGGNYTFVATILGERWGGMYGMAFTLNSFACGMFGLGLGTYLNALIPSVNIKLTAVIAITLFWIANMLGVKFMAKIQNVMSVCLLVGLAVFIVVGLFNLRPGTFDFSSPEFFTGGASGFFNGTLLLVFSCTGQSFIVAFSKEAKNPRRDVPFAITAASGVILVVYALIAIVAVLCLPKRIPDAWENRYFKISKPAFYAIMTFCLCVTLFVIGLSLRNLTPTLVIVTVVLITLFFIYSTFRQKSGKVQMEKSYELQ